MKRLVITIICLVAMTGSAFASPLTDYSAGKVAVDFTFYPNLKMEADHSDGGIVKTDAKQKFAFGLTTGLGNKWAVQYRYFSPEGVDPISTDRTNRTKTQEFNLLYQLNKNWSVFAGYHSAKYDLSFYDSVWSQTHTKGTAQFGLIGSTKIFDKTRLFGSAGFGNRLTNLEFGLSYEVSPNLEFNLTYRYFNSDKLKFTAPFTGVTLDTKFTGWGLGITCKF